MQLCFRPPWLSPSAPRALFLFSCTDTPPHSFDHASSSPVPPPRPQYNHFPAPPSRSKQILGSDSVFYLLLFFFSFLPSVALNLFGRCWLPVLSRTMFSCCRRNEEEKDTTAPSRVFKEVEGVSTTLPSLICISVGLAVVSQSPRSVGVCS